MEFILEFVLHFVAIYPGAFVIWTIKGYKGRYRDILGEYDLFLIGIVGISSILGLIILGVFLS